MTPTQRLYGRVVAMDGLLAPLLMPQTMLFLNEEGDAVIFAGQHIRAGFCWCQPAVRPTLNGFYVKHRGAAN